MRDYAIRDAGGIELLLLACEATDRAAALRSQIDRDGELIPTRASRSIRGSRASWPTGPSFRGRYNGSASTLSRFGRASDASAVALDGCRHEHQAHAARTPIAALDLGDRARSLPPYVRAGKSVHMSAAGLGRRVLEAPAVCRLRRVVRPTRHPAPGACHAAVVLAVR
jgi:hypothetical protein